MTVRTLIAENKTTMRVRVKGFLAAQPGIEVVGEAADGHEAVQKTRELRPDVVIMDVGMPGMNGLAATRLLKEELPAVQVIMLTVYDLPEYLQAAMSAGASGYVIKTALLHDLLPAIEGALGYRLEASEKGARKASGLGRQVQERSGPSTADEGLSVQLFEEMVVREKVMILRNVAAMSI